MNSSKWIYNPALGAILLLLSVGLDRTLPAQAGGHQQPVTANTFDSPDSNPATATFITFDVPGAATIVPYSINDGGTVTGDYTGGSTLAVHGFLRGPGGALITFDAPGAGTGLLQGTRPESINSGGTVTGYYLDANNAYHGFLRGLGGAFTSIDVPGAGTGSFQGTVPESINSSGTVTGYYRDTNNMDHGFLRIP